MLTTYTIDGFENIKYQGFGLIKYIENVLSDLFEHYGYCRVETPTFEAYEFYSGEDLNHTELFKLIDHTGKVLVLKPDATLPVTRMAAINHRDPEEIVKLCYQTNVFKAFTSDDPSEHETIQAGVEYFGNDEPVCDGEIIALAIASLKKFGITDIHIDIGHVGFINALLDELGLNEEEKNTLIEYIEKKNGDDIRTFLEQSTIDPKYYEYIALLPELFGEPIETIAVMRKLALNESMEQVVDYLEAVYKYLEDIGLAEYIKFDIGFTNRMSYYTGIIFKGYMKNTGEPVIRGGRYDDLSQKFGIDRPACGFAIDVLGLFDYLRENKLLPASSRIENIILYEPNERSLAHRFAERMRENDQRTEMFELDRPVEEFLKRLYLNTHYVDTNIFLLNPDGTLRSYGGTHA